MSSSSISRFALPAVISLISFLSYGPQVLFRYIEPHPLSPRQSCIFNLLVACIWICYARACFTDPGHVPKDWGPNGSKEASIHLKSRWCRKCEVLKPPRSHHCKTCKRCVPKMDHHCPWTLNCVSYRTFPHFFRFLFYAVAAMIHLEYFLYVRVAIVWNGRALPSYLGPSSTQLIFLFIFTIVNSITLFALAVLLARNIWVIGSNITTIEGWEIERHETLLRRANARGGYLDGPDGVRVKISKQEFPYDIGVYENAKQAMNGSPLTWLSPFATTPGNIQGLRFETNNFEDPSISWPPPDPDRMPRRQFNRDGPFLFNDAMKSGPLDVRAFRTRQQQDLARSRLSFKETSETCINNNLDNDINISGEEECQEGGRTIRNSDGDCLQDFGVDESLESYAGEDMPLAGLLRRRTANNDEFPLNSNHLNTQSYMLS